MKIKVFHLVYKLVILLFTSVFLNGCTPEGPSCTPRADNTFKVLSWNLSNFGASKDSDELEFIANEIRGYDLVGIQEVTSAYEGDLALRKLLDYLRTDDDCWAFSLSEPTGGSGSERYAFLWREGVISASAPGFLVKDNDIDKSIDREPYMQEFRVNFSKKRFYAAVFHAVPEKKKPENEIIELVALPKNYTSAPIILLGDFNLAAKNKAFKPLEEKGFKPTFKNQKTSLKTKGSLKNALNKPYDNIFYQSSGLRLIKGGIREFHKKFPSIYSARKISDHVPVWAEFDRL